MSVGILKTSLRHNETLDSKCMWNVIMCMILCVSYMVIILELTKSCYDCRFHKI